jgi:hypothetical protein
MASFSKLTPVEMVIMATLRCTPLKALEEYRRIEPILINLNQVIMVARGVTTGDTLNVRELPALTSGVLGQFAQGLPLEIWGRGPEGLWLAVRNAQAEAGWVSAQWVKEVRG